MAGDLEQTDATGKYQLGGRNHSEGGGASKYLPACFKLIELILCVICIGLFDDPANEVRNRLFTSPRTVGLCYATFATYLIFSAVFIIGRGLRENIQWKSSAILSCLAALLFIACAATVLKDWSETKVRNQWPPNTQRLDLLCATGFISLLAAVVYVVDLIYTVIAGVRGSFDDE